MGTTTGKRGRKVARISQRLLTGTSLAALMLLLPLSVQAADWNWDSNQTAVGNGGTGTWNLTNQFWSPSSDGVSGPYVYQWDNSALDNAIFGGTAGTVTLGAPITAYNLTFNTTGYVLSGGTLTLGGSSPSITTNSGTTTINSVVTSTQGLVKDGTGTLQLSGANTFSGDISILGGTLYGLTDGALGAASNNISTAAGASVALRIDGAGTARSVTIGDGGALSVSGAGVGSALITGNGRVSVGNGVTLSNDASTYTGSTTFNGVNGVANSYFTSIANLGQASSLGAPTTVTDGTIVFNQSSQYSDNVIYLGDGDSSDRNWQLSGSAALIRNRGTGTLSITGNINTSGGSGFYAENADIELLGVLSGGSYSFTALAGHAITLGGTNTFTGDAAVGGLVHASVIADGGSASSFGAGTNIALSAGTVSYTGTGASSDRVWTGNGAGGILNDGSGALALNGSFAFSPVAPNPDSLTLGGSFTGISTYSGIISGTGNLISDGAGTWVLDGANTFAGSVTVNNGTLQAGSVSAFGAATGFTVNGGTLDLGGFDLTAPSLTGTGGTVALGGNTLSVNATTAQTYGGSITGTGGLTKTGAGTLTLTGASSYTGATTIGGGTLALDFSGAGGPTSNIISSSSPLLLSGGTLHVVGADGETNSQGFAGTTVTAGSNTVQATEGAGGSANLDLGAVTRTGGLVNFVVPGTGAIMTSNADGALGGWATIDGSDYAKVDGGAIVAFDASDYTDKDDAGTWAPGEVISDTAGVADSPFFGTVASNVQLGGLRYTAAADSTVTVAAGNTLGVDGTIIVAPSVGTDDQTITGGSLTGGASGGALGLQQNGGGTFTIGSTIVDNGGATSFAKGGTGTLALTGANSYTGATTLTDGTLRVNDIGNGGAASNIGASSAASSNLVLEGGDLQYTDGTATTDRGFTLVNGGGDRTIEVTNGATNLTFTGQVTSPDDAGFTKAGPGTLTLANTGNDYVGVTTVTGGTLAISTLTDGGLPSSIGAASSDPANIVLAGGDLSYLGGTTGSDRGITLNTGGGGIDVADVGTTLTLSGVITGPASLRANGPGTLVLSGANTYANGTTVNGGTLRAGAVNVFGTGSMTVNAGGLLDLNNFNNAVNGLSGAGNIDLGSATLTDNNGGNFTGTISGTGGLTRAGTNQFTLTLSGCHNSYTGATTISGTSLAVGCLANGGVASDIGASTNDPSNLSFSNGTLIYTGGNVTTDRGFTLVSSTGTINVSNAATTLEFSGNIVGAGGLRKDGPGALVLSGTNSSTGNATILQGTLRAGSTSALGSGALTLSNTAGALLDLVGFDNSVAFLTGGGTTGGNISLGSATLTINTGSSLVGANYAGAISGSGNLVKNGANIQQLSGCANSYSGTTTITRGTLAVACLPNGGANSSIGASTSAASNLVLNGGTLQYVGAGDSTDRQFTLGAATGNALDASGTGTINFTSSAPLTFSSPDTAQTLTLTGTNTDNNTLAAQITNNGAGLTALTKTGVGTWILTNPNSSYTGITTISGGVLGVDKLADGGLASSIGASSAAASNLVIGNGSTLRYTGAGDSTNRLFTLAAGVTFIQSSGTGAIVFTDTGPVTLASNNQARTIALGGTNTGNNTLAGSIGDAGTGITTFAKNDSGTWILTGNSTYTGTTNINAGILYLGNGGTTGSVASAIVNNFGTLGFNRSDDVTYAGMIVGTGSVLQDGSGTTILTGANTYTGGTTINAGTLQLGSGGATGSITGDVVDDGIFAFDRSDSYVFNGLISGSGIVSQIGTGTTILTADNSYTGGTTISTGTLQIGNGSTTGSILGDITDNAALAFNRSDDISFGGTVSGTGSLTQLGAGTLTLTADNSYAGGTTVSAGTLQIGDGGATGSITGDVTDNSALMFDRSGTLALDGMISGTGTVTQAGPGTTILTGTNTYDGATNVAAGTLLVNGDQSGAAGLTSVASGATLGGMGKIGGSVTVADGGALNPGGASATPGTLAIAGNLALGATSTLNYDFGQANVVGGPLNDLVTVGGNLTLGGTLNVTQSPGGSFGPGVYRIVSYNGTLTNNGLTIGTMPAGSDTVIQTAVANQVNLVNTAGLTFSYWDGDAGPQNDGAVNGGNGTWLAAGDHDWTSSDGSINAAFANASFAIFEGAPGTVTVDNTGGQVQALGMQFVSSGYLVQGSPIELVPDTNAQSIIHVGDGTAASAGYTATIASVLTGTSELVKTDLGMLVLSGINSYTGGTAIDGGTLSVASDANLGDGAGSLSFDGGTLETTADITSGRDVTLAGTGTFLTDASTTLTLTGPISGAGNLTKDGTGTLVVTGDAAQTGGTTINAGTLQIGNGGTTGTLVGDVADNGTLVFDRSDSLTFGGVVSGTGNLQQIGPGTTILTGDSSYSGGTTVTAGTLQFGNGGTSGSITGDVIDNGTLAFDRSDAMTFAGTISGTGGINQIGAGTTILTGTNSYGGPTNVAAGTLLIDGNQSGASGLTSVASGATLGGTGTIGGDVTVADGGAINPGDAGNVPGTLTVNGSLALSAASSLNYNFGQAGVVGGAFNDLTAVGGNLTLGGTINVASSAGGSFDPGVYRVISYNGTLTNPSGLALGTIPAGTTFFVQTSVAQQVNLVNTTGLTLRFWDGAAGPKNDGVVNGGDGIWQGQNPLANDNWTEVTGTANAPWTDAAFAVFEGAPGTVTVDATTQGPVHASGMQFAADGYTIQGEPISLVADGNGQSIIRVGDGTAAGAGYTATIASVLTGTSELVKTDLGTLVLTGTNTYTGGTAINGGTLAIASDTNLGDAAGSLSFDGGTLETTADVTSGRAVTLAGAGTFLTDAGTTTTLSGAITGAGTLMKDGTGTLVVTGDAAQTGGTMIAAGTLQVGNGGTTGTLAGDVMDNGTLAITRSDAVTFAGTISGTGGVNQIGAGTTILTGNNSYSGPTTVQTGMLLVNGDQSAATGLTTVANGATLGGTGIIGGDVTVADGAINPGQPNAPGTLTINGGLALGPNSVLNYRFGQAGVVGGPLNDLVTVGGDLTLDGTLNVTTPPGGNFGPGIYRVISYGGNLIADNTLELGTMPADANVTVQSSIAHQVNLVDGGGQTLTYWDGDAGTRNDGVIAGGDGVWRASGDDNWTDAAGASNAAYANGDFAVFAGAPGAVTVDGSNGVVQVSGMQFATNGYTIQGDPITLTGDQATIRVGDGTSDGTGYTATIASALTGSAGLAKTDLGTLVLSGTNSYTGATDVLGGTLAVEGSIASSAVTVHDGATLAGNGTAGATTLQAGGTVAPGNSIGMLTVNGAFSQAAGATYQVEVDPNSSASDLITVNGAASLSDGAILNVTKTSPADYRVGTVYTVLTASNGVSGTYDLTGDITSVSSFLALKDTYDANDVYLTVVQTRGIDDVAQTPNQVTTGHGLDSLPPGNPITTAILNLPSDDAARTALDKLSGDSLASIKSVMLSDGRYVRDAALGRAADMFCDTGRTHRLDDDSDIGQQAAAGCIAASNRPVVWAQGFGAWGGIGSDGNAAGVNHTTAGFLVGVDVPVWDWRAGVFGGHSSTDYGIHTRGASAESSDYHLGAYAGNQWGALGLRLGASYTWSGIDSIRPVAIGNFSNLLQGTYNAGTTQAFAELGYRLNAWTVDFEPFANLAYVNLHTGGFTETGGAAALTSLSDTMDNVVSTLGVRPSTQIDFGSFGATARGMLGWQHTYGDVLPTDTFTLAGSDPFTTAGVPIARDAAAVEAGLDFNLGGNATFGVTYSGRFASKTTDQGMRGTFRINF